MKTFHHTVSLVLRLARLAGAHATGAQVSLPWQQFSVRQEAAAKKIIDEALK
jgi:hypothetical protein